MKIISDNVELIELQFNSIHAKPFLIISWCHSPASRVDEASFEYLRDILKEADKEEKEIILIGDTNCDINSHQNSNTKNEQKTTKSLIDHFSTTKPGNALIADILRIGMCDHYMIFGIRKLNARKFRRKKEESLKPAVLANMIRNLSETTQA